MADSNENGRLSASELGQAALTTVDFTPWHELLSELQDIFTPLFERDARRARSGDEMFRDARMLVAEAAERARSRQTQRITRWLRAVSETAVATTSAVLVVDSASWHAAMKRVM